MQRKSRFSFIAEPKPIVAFNKAMIVQGERNTKKILIFFHCRTEAYHRFCKEMIE